MDSRLDFESERVSPGFFGEVDLGSKPGLILNDSCLESAFSQFKTEKKTACQIAVSLVMML